MFCFLYILLIFNYIQWLNQYFVISTVLSSITFFYCSNTIIPKIKKIIAILDDMWKLYMWQCIPYNCFLITTKWNIVLSNIEDFILSTTIFHYIYHLQVKSFTPHWAVSTFLCYFSQIPPKNRSAHTTLSNFYFLAAFSKYTAIK